MMKGYLAIIAASLLYGIMPVLSKLLLLEGMNSSSIVVWRFCFSTVFCLAIMLIKKIPFQATPRQIGVMIVVGILGFGMTATLVTAAYNYIPVGLATMFQFSYPLFVLIIMVILTKEKIGALRAVAVAFLAVGLVLMMDFSGGANYTGIALAQLSGVTYAFYVVSNQRSCFRMLDGFTTMFYAMVASSIFFTLQSLVSGQLMAPPTPKSWLLAMIIGLFCTVFSLRLLLYGISVLGASNASILNILEPLTSLISGALIYGDQLSIPTMIGCGLVILAILLVSLAGKISQNKTKQRKNSL